MWVVLKYNKNELNFLVKDFKKILGNSPLVFRPKLKYQKLVRNKLQFLEKDILNDYLICYHEQFKSIKILTILKNLRGLKYFLTNSQTNQKEITDFINHCEKNQDSDGYIKPSFFEFSNMNKGIFLSGPFTNMIFSVIEKQKNELKVLIGKMKTTITKKSNYLYRPV